MFTNIHCGVQNWDAAVAISGVVHCVEVRRVHAIPGC